MQGVYVSSGDLARSPLTVVPIAAHVSASFTAGRGFDANPVTWHTLARHGIAVRGPDPGALGVHVDDRELRAWTLANLHGYWTSWAAAARGCGWVAAQALTRHGAAWGALGAPRLLHTIETGAIVTKEHAGRYALHRLGPRWHPIVEEALAYWRGDPPRAPYRDPWRRRRDATALVEHVVAVAGGASSGTSPAGGSPTTGERHPEVPSSRRERLDNPTSRPAPGALPADWTLVRAASRHADRRAGVERAQADLHSRIGHLALAGDVAVR